MRLTHLRLILLVAAFGMALSLRGETVLLYLEPDTSSLALATVAVDSSTYLAAEEVPNREGWYRTTYSGFFGGFTRGDNLRPDGKVSPGSEIFLTPSERGRLLAVTEPGDDIVVNLPGRWTEITIRKTVPAYFRKHLPSQQRRVPFDLAEILRDPEPLPEETSPEPARTPLLGSSPEVEDTERPETTDVKVPEMPEVPDRQPRPRLSTTEPPRDATITRPIATDAATERPMVPIPARPFEESTEPLEEVALPETEPATVAIEEEESPEIAPTDADPLPEELISEAAPSDETATEEEDVVIEESAVALTVTDPELAEAESEPSRRDTLRAEVLETSVEMDLEEAEVRGLERPALQRQIRIPPASDIGQTFQGRLVRSRTTFGRAPYDFELQDSRGRRLAWVDTTDANATSLSGLIGEVVSVYGILRTRERGRGRVIEARNIHGFR